MGAENESPDNVDKKLDRIITELSAIRIEFSRQRDLENERWERLLPVLRSVVVAHSPLHVGGTDMLPPSPVRTTSRKRRPSNAALPKPKRLRFAAMSPK